MGPLDYYNWPPTMRAGRRVPDSRLDVLFGTIVLSSELGIDLLYGDGSIRRECFPLLSENARLRRGGKRI